MSSDFGLVNGIDAKATILIVDDDEINRMILDDMLYEDYNIEQAENGIEALKKLSDEACKPSLVLLDIIMPEMNGLEVLQRMRSNETTKKIPVILITVEKEYEAKGLSEGAVDYIFKPFDHNIVKSRIDNQMELARYRENLEFLVNKKVNELTAAKEKVLTAVASFIEARSIESGEHVKRTSILTGIIAELLLKNPLFRDELLEKDYNIMVKATPLHDVGKIAVPDNILLKPGKLTPEEFGIMETHTTIGSEMIQQMQFEEDENDLYLMHCYNICRYHHERWDGKGYPDKLASTDIPLSARIVSIVDVYDALVSQRVYKPPFSHEEAMKIIAEDSGKKFDADIVNELLKSDYIFKQVYGI
ncbi:MAG: response regulator [Oscillospiraceae bacterium]|nr:response regulator [Oscillospiraceae bacterium]